MEDRLSIAAIIGRPNVGKSSLFNKMLGRRKAIVVDISGTTRDRIFADISHKGLSFKLVDTGGIDLISEGKMKAQVKRQAQLAAEQAQVFVFVCDAISGVAPLDLELASLLRKYNKKIILVANKIDNKEAEARALDFYQLGLGKPFCVSAEHNRGVGELLDEIARHIVPVQQVQAQPAIKVAIAGRPNVGKSSFINCLLHEERVIVHETPGTTRDAIDVYFQKDGQDYTLIDTAGMRHKKKIKEIVEFFGLSRTKESIKRSDVCVFIMDAREGIAKDDLSILSFIQEQGKPFVILANKWDLVKDVTVKEYEAAIRQRLSFTIPVPVLFVSCLLDKNVNRSFELIKIVMENAAKTIETSKLNKAIERYVSVWPPKGEHNRRPKLFYATQTGVKPPTFLVFAKNSEFIAEAYKKYIEKKISADFGFNGAPIRINYREKQR